MRLPELRADRQHRVQARHRILEDHRDLLAPNAAPRALGEADQLPPLELDASGGDPGRPREDPHRRQRRDALPAARLADEPERLARADVERDAVHRVDEAAARPEADAQVVDREQRRLAHVRPRSFGSIASRMASPMRLNPITAITIAMPGKTARNGAVCR